ncbi:hypothetical protein F0562_028301 [Nyssa sinensis]|uniref:Endoglucanase n=1 Tax=Nyssa sinensis TaxID=561372 RepID=A0A5J5B7W9_9ASTE|nr:hypothetical protein F0562_028301 [Nyssa sinensis]
MQTPRSVLKIDQSTPGTEIAAETSAAMAASSIAMQHLDRPYARRLLNKAKLMDYILGKNPQERSYMVGFGKNPPTQPHHRGASVPKMPANQVVSCSMSFVHWFSKKDPNPNELTGAIVGGPDRYDNFVDQRWESAMTEPTTYTNSLAIGVLAKLATHHANS